MITVGSCFAGIGGIELGLESTGGFKTVWQIEKDPYAIGVLKKHWPHVSRHGDIKTVDAASLEKVDLICGGYPCQPFSLAGKRSGENDPRHLWPDMFRIVRALRPRLVLLENVPGHLSMGCGRVLADLSESGYDAEWGVLSAAGVGAPHLRKRLFIVAHTPSGGWPVRRGASRQTGQPARRSEAVANAERPWRGEPASAPQETGEPLCAAIGEEGAPVSGSGGETLADPKGVGVGSRLRASSKTGIGRRRPGDEGWWAIEPNVGRVAHGIPNRVDRLTCLGNAVVPQVAAKVGRMILEFDQ